MKNNFICTVKLLPKDQWSQAAAKAVTVNPMNAPSLHMLKLTAPDTVLNPEHLALLTSKYWGNKGVFLTVGFLDNPPIALRARILLHMNAWGIWANVNFVETTVDPQVRIARIQGVNGGYWSYIGTDILEIPANEPTMNLDSFTMNTADANFFRVIRHETGHTLGFPHEHLRTEIVNRIDKDKAIQYFMTVFDWSKDDVIANVLTPINESALIATAEADTKSIMCYSLPAFIMKDNIAVEGGSDIDSQDASFAASVYPKIVNPFWESLDGTTQDSVTAVSWSKNRLDLFVHGTDNSIYHKLWNGSKWGGWESLGGATLNPVTAVSWDKNRLDLFVRGTDNAIYHKWWNGSKWSGWESLDGTTQDSVTAVSWSKNRLDLFVRGTDNAIYHKWWNGSKWGGWESLGGATLNPVTAVSWDKNRLDLFVRGTDNVIYHKWWNGSKWGGWESLDGSTKDPVAAVSWDKNRLDLFVRGTDNAIYHKLWNGSKWGGWESLGGATLNPVTAVSWDKNRLDLFVRGTDNAIYHKWWNGSGWGGWESLGGATLNHVTAISWDKNRLDLFVRGTDNSIYHKWWNGSKW